ncbi:MAG: CocE/NonD family hydrolase [Paludibaculum sp.]
MPSGPSNVPTMWEQGLWDQEDMYGAIHCYEALKAKGRRTTTSWSWARGGTARSTTMATASAR